MSDQPGGAGGDGVTVASKGESSQARELVTEGVGKDKDEREEELRQAEQRRRDAERAGAGTRTPTGSEEAGSGWQPVGVANDGGTKRHAGEVGIYDGGIAKRQKSGSHTAATPRTT